jgi:hypothetical protein
VFGRAFLRFVSEDWSNVGLDLSLQLGSTDPITFTMSVASWDPNREATFV